VDFSSYDVVVVASDFGGLLRQAELDVLNARSADLIAFVNDGGGLVALAESNGGAGLTPAGGHFDFLPFLATELVAHQTEANYSVTPFGATEIGLTNAAVNGNFSHNIFTDAGGMQVVDIDGSGRMMSLATRGNRICPSGVPTLSVTDASVVESDAPALTAIEFTVSLANPCGAEVQVDYATAPGTAAAVTDFVATTGTLTFAPGVTTQTVSVPIVNDNQFEADEYLLLNLTNPVGASIADSQATGDILNDDAANSAPDCSNVTADTTELWPPNHELRTVVLSGATDSDGDPVVITIDGVTQDEVTNGRGDGDVAPDAAMSSRSDAVQLRAERSGKGDGRVYRVAFSASDDNGATCSGTVTVGVRHATPQAPVDSGGSFDSFSG
jgi:hypothetical protein